MLVAKEVFKSYEDLHVLRGINLHLTKGEIISIVGKSGTGKSTLLHILGSLDTADSGSVTIQDVDVMSLSEKDRSAFRNKHIGFIFQFHHLLPEFNALENVYIPALIGKTPKDKAVKKAKELLDYLGLKDRLTHKPNQLSGGEQQRVAIARALINNPSVIFADEPTGNLDEATSNELHELFLKLRNEMEQSFIIVTHNKELAALSDRTLTMSNGLLS